MGLSRRSVLAAAGIAGVAFMALRFARAASEEARSREELLDGVARLIGCDVDGPIFDDRDETLRSFFARLSDADLVVMQTHLGRVAGAIARRAGSIDPLAVRWFLREIRVNPVERLAKPVVDTVVVDVRSCPADVLFDDAQGSSLKTSIPVEKSHEPEDQPLDVLQRDVGALGGILAREGTFRLIGDTLHLEFSIGDRASVSETAERVPPGLDRSTTPFARART